MGHSNHTINYDAIPGNVELVDLDGHLAAAVHSKGDKSIVLIPTPSEDPDDPLNWTTKRKWLSIFSMVVYTFGVGVPSAAIYSILPNISDETGITLSQLNAGTGYMFLFLGIGCFIFQPLALQYGKRPVYLFSVFATAVVCLWSPFCKSNGEWIGSKIIQGLVSSPIESLCEISVSDVSFQHQLARNMGIYAVSLITSNFLAPMVAGFINQGIGWQWVMYLCCIWGCTCGVFMFFFMEETNYERKLNPDKLLKKYEEIDAINASSGDEKNVVSVTVDDEKKVQAVLSRESIAQRLQSVNEAFADSDDESATPKPMKTYRQKISLTGGVKSKFLLGHYFLGPFKMMQFPPVLWAGFLYGSSLVWFNLLNATEATILMGPPYHFKSSMTGLAYISPTIFAVLFQYLGGNLSDTLKVRFARRKGGASIPEDRFWSLTIYMVLGLLASIGWGVGAYYGKHWFLLVVSMGVLGGCGVFAIICSCTYVVDCYHEMETEAMVVVIIIRNVMSFACSYGLTDWVMNMGYKNAFISSGFILFGCNATFLIMRYTGEYWRNKTKGRYWKLVENHRKVIAGN